MNMTSYLASYREKWVSLYAGTGAYVQGVIKDVGDDYIVVQESENQNPLIFNIRNVVYVKALRTKENGKPKVFG